MNRALLRIAIGLIGCTGLALDEASSAAAAADVRDLLQALKRYGFQVVQRPPTSTNAYGQFIPGQKLLLIAPISHDLGIARHVLLHEAVHAAQSCPDGRLRLLNLNLQTAPAVNNRIRYLLNNHYNQGSRMLEQEAFLIQSQPNAEALIIKALQQRCQEPGG